MKLITKFSLSTSLLVVVIITAVSVVLFVYQRRMLIEEIRQNQVVLINGLTEVTKESLVLHNDLLLLNYLKRVKKTKGVMYAMLIDTEGEIMAHNNVRFLGKTIADVAGLKAKSIQKFYTQSYINNRKEKIFELNQAVYVDSEKKGVVRIGLSQDVINQTIGETLVKIRRPLLTIGISALVLGIVGSLILSYGITMPVKTLAQGAVLIGKGELGHRIEVKGRSELSGLAYEFNSMAVKLEELDQLKDDFVSSVSHELRSPLTAINGYAEHLQTEYSGPLNEEQQEFVGIIKKNAGRLGKFVNDVLDIAKIEAGEVDIELKPVEIAPVIEDIIVLFRAIAGKKTISLEASIEPGIPLSYLDRDRLSQVLTNIVSNALKFTPDGGKIIVKAKEVPESDFIEISVTDTGMGIPADQLDKVFDRFHQVKDARGKVKGAKGTGLGLAIVKGIIEAQGGKIWAKSPAVEEQKGTAFYFTVPKYKDTKNT
jgi:two-component system sensor histidine kinase GlrK